jgi:molecular chaperone DnaK
MRGVPQIEVTFDIDANGIINVSALDKGTNKQQTIRIESSSGLSKEEIEIMKQEAELNAENDKKIKEEIDTINGAESLLFQSRNSIKDLEEKITEEQKSELENSLKELEDSLKEKKIEKVKTSVDKVNTTFTKITQEMYSNVTNQDVGKDEVEFEEVKN